MATDQDPSWGKYLTAGIEIAVGIALGYVVGHYIDGKLKTGPWGMVIGILLGCASGMYLLIREALRMNKD